MSATVLHLVNGVAFFTESLEVKSTGYVLDAKATVALQPTQGANGQMGMNATKMSDAAFRPTEIKVPLSSVVYMQDVTDGEFLSQMRAHLAGIIMPDGHAHVPKALRLERK